MHDWVRHPECPFRRAGVGSGLLGCFSRPCHLCGGAGLEHSRPLRQCPARARLNASRPHNFVFQSSVLGQHRVGPRLQALEQSLRPLSTAPCSKSILQWSQMPPPSLCPGWLKYSFFCRNSFSLVIWGLKTLELRSWEKYGPDISSTEG